jgi:hypothetical protein
MTLDRVSGKAKNDLVIRYAAEAQSTIRRELSERFVDKLSLSPFRPIIVLLRL